MAEKEMINELKEHEVVYHTYLLKSWNERKLTQLFHQNIETWVTDAVEQSYYSDAVDMYLMQLNRVMYDFEDGENKIEKMMQIVNACSEVIEKVFVYKWWALESHHQTIHNYKNVATGKNIPVTPRKPDAHAMHSFPEDDFILAMQSETSIYAAKQEEYLSILEKAYMHCKKLLGKKGRGIFRSGNVQPVKFYTVLNERIMIVLCALARTNEAEYYVDELEKIIKVQKTTISPTLRYNIAYYYFYAGQYKKMLKHADILINELTSNKRLYYQALGMKAYSHIFLGEYNEVRRCIPQEVLQINLDEYVQFRIAEMILWYYDDELDAAMRECMNIKRMLRNKPKQEVQNTILDFRKLVHHYKELFEALTSIPSEKMKKLHRVKDNMQAFTKNYQVVLHQTPALAWLNTTLAQLPKH